MNDKLYYPISQPRERKPKKVVCFVCVHGMVKDAKTGRLRDCVACKGTAVLDLDEKIYLRDRKVM